MIDPPILSKPRVIHLAPLATPRSSTGLTETVDRWLADLGAQVERHGDAYRSLARILRGNPNRLQGAIVCVDAVSPAEMEFFSLLSRLRRQLRIYVYSNGNGDRKISDALRRGAVGLVSQDALRSLIGAPPEAEDDAAAGLTQRPGEPESVRAPEQPPEFQEENTPEEDVAEAARVPWLRYNDRPERAAPARPRPPATSGGIQEPSPSADAYEPLLTQAELDALMSDDISTIAPNEPLGWCLDEDAPRGGP